MYNPVFHPSLTSLGPVHRPRSHVRLVWPSQEILTGNRIPVSYSAGYIRRRFSVSPIVEQLREARLRWFGHVPSGKVDTVRKIDFNLEAPGKRPRRRPKQAHVDT
ncbi:unnamed protein product [Heligmosomoides polygyrus]|uniref:Transposase n=1 Tax=Heligmosomoides polygyrus TaxID=6339 RepID=A0A183G8K9_HELPZ|nr:unnamed protein product [Heligmosomoides polygyrus]